MFGKSDERAKVKCISYKARLSLFMSPTDTNFCKQESMMAGMPGIRPAGGSSQKGEKGEFGSKGESFH